MAIKIIDGKKISLDIKTKLKERITILKQRGIEPGLATILVGDNPASNSYVSSKIKTCNELGIRSYNHKLPATTEEKDIIDLIEKLNKDSNIDGILLQLPLPHGISSERCIKAITPQKDVDGLNPFNLGLLVGAKTWDDIQQQRLIMPCTPLGIIELLKRSNIDISYKQAVVLGRSNLVGKPIAMMLLAHNATVTVAHSYTKDLDKISSHADILIAAIGKPKFINKKFVKPGAVVIDVGINRTLEGIVGDVDFNDVKDVAGYITPVPGGVGPMTVTMLMSNTILAAEKNRSLI